MQNLVTILIPCYNSAPYLTRPLESILMQTYKNIEIILIDDGSTDETKSIFHSYKDKFNKKGYQSKYIYQNNAGQAAAMNNGLKHVNGKFLAWIDSDDEITENSIKERAECLLGNPDSKVVFSQARVVDNDSGKFIGIIKLKNENLDNRDLLEAYASERDIYVTNCCYLIDFASFKKANKGINISTSRAGQNWQMLLPMARDYSFTYINKPLCTYYIRKDSHSHSKDGDKNQLLEKIRDLKLLLLQILKELDVSDYHKKIANDSYLAKKLVILANFNDKHAFNKTLKLKSRTTSITIREIITLVLINTSIIKLKHWLIYNRKQHQPSIGKSSNE